MIVPSKHVETVHRSEMDGPIVYSSPLSWITKEPVESLRDAIDADSDITDASPVGLAEFLIGDNYDGYGDSSWGAVKEDSKFKHAVFFYTGPQDGSYEVDWHRNAVHLVGEGEPTDDGYQEADLYNRVTLTSRGGQLSSDVLQHYLSQTTDLGDEEVEQYVDKFI